jgi:hypothetical protein
MPQKRGDSVLSAAWADGQVQPLGESFPLMTLLNFLYLLVLSVWQSTVSSNPKPEFLNF